MGFNVGWDDRGFFHALGIILRQKVSCQFELFILNSFRLLYLCVSHTLSWNDSHLN